MLPVHLEQRQKIDKIAFDETQAPQIAQFVFLKAILSIFWRCSR
jgi:hypothetical protein